MRDQASDADLIPTAYQGNKGLPPSMFVGENGATGMPLIQEDKILDSIAGQNLHLSLVGNWRRELDIQSPWRQEMAADEAIFDGTGHWSTAEVLELSNRGQVPLVYNVTATAVNWLLGDQRRNPVDYKILARKKEGSGHAEQKTQLMKYLADVDNMAITEGQAYSEQVKAGLSWLETGVRPEDEGEVVYQRHESWRNVLHDSAAQDWALEDARYIFRAKWIDLDRAAAMFPQRRHILYQASNKVLESQAYADDNMGDYAMDSLEMRGDGLTATLASMYPGRRRVRLYEGWYRRPKESKVIRGGEFSGEVYAPGTDRHEWALKDSKNRAQVITKVMERVHVALFCDAGLLHHQLSPYRHNSMPFTPVWGYRRAADMAPYGLIRQVRDIQKDLNKRASKALWHATARRVIVEAGAVDDLDDLRDEMMRPDAVIVHKKGTAPPVLESDLQYAAAQAELMQKDAEMIERTSGVSSENKGAAQSGAQSGRAIIALQDQGILTTNIFPENMRHARKVHGEKVLSNIEQFYDQEKVFRITNERGNAEYIGINDDTPTDNAITTSRADFIVSEQDYRASHRQANLADLTELVSTIGQSSPEVALKLLDLLVEAMDVPKKDEIVKRIRQITGQADPDADPNTPDPEQEAIQAAKDAQAAMEERLAMANIEGAEAKVALDREKAAKLKMDTGKVLSATEAEQIAKIGSAITVATQMGGLPALAAAAEKVLAISRDMTAGSAPPTDLDPMAGAMPVAEPLALPPPAEPMAPPMEPAPMPMDPALAGAMPHVPPSAGAPF